MAIRIAASRDIGALRNIYAQYIATPVTFEYTLPSLQDFAARVQGILSTYPYLAWEKNRQVLGYAYTHRQKEREAYQWNAELSIYLEPGYTAKSIGKKLYLTLMEILKLQGIKNVYGCVTIPNPRSDRLHESLGFRQLGIYCATGYKCGQWHDVARFEKELFSGNIEPHPPISIWQSPKKQLSQVMQKY